LNVLLQLLLLLEFTVVISFQECNYSGAKALALLRRAYI